MANTHELYFFQNETGTIDGEKWFMLGARHTHSLPGLPPEIFSQEPDFLKKNFTNFTCVDNRFFVFSIIYQAQIEKPANQSNADALVTYDENIVIFDTAAAPINVGHKNVTTMDVTVVTPSVYTTSRIDKNKMKRSFSYFLPHSYLTKGYGHNNQRDDKDTFQWHKVPGKLSYILSYGQELVLDAEHPQMATHIDEITGDVIAHQVLSFDVASGLVVTSRPLDTEWMNDKKFAKNYPFVTNDPSPLRKHYKGLSTGYDPASGIEIGIYSTTLDSAPIRSSSNNSQQYYLADWFALTTSGFQSMAWTDFKLPEKVEDQQCLPLPKQEDPEDDTRPSNYYFYPGVKLSLINFQDKLFLATIPDVDIDERISSKQFTYSLIELRPEMDADKGPQANQPKHFKVNQTYDGGSTYDFNRLPNWAQMCVAMNKSSSATTIMPNQKKLIVYNDSLLDKKPSSVYYTEDFPNSVQSFSLPKGYHLVDFGSMNYSEKENISVAEVHCR